jgi:hypothetical protein
MDRGPDIVAAALAEGLSRNQCVSAWLGPGNVLFLGLGTAVIAERDPDGRRSTPPYELQTNFADWTIELPGGPTIAADDRDRSRAAARALIGRPVLEWQVGDGHALQIHFHGGLLLNVAPTVGPELAGKAAWWLCLPGGRTVAVACDGRVIATDSRRLNCDWFKRPGE